MNKYKIYVEIKGKKHLVGFIADGRFIYDAQYLENKESAPISISLPLQKEAFPESRTKAFFEGLLPEGYTRKTLAGWLHLDIDDYLALLGILGQECLGAIQILGEGVSSIEAGYELLSMEQMKEIAREGASKSAEIVTKSHLSLTGASGKTGLLLQDGKWYMPKGDAPSTHIVKQSHVRLDNIVLNEQLSMLTAKELGMDVSESFMINLGQWNETDVLFASKRYDRLISEKSSLVGKIKRPYRLHQEDFAQAMGIESRNKYEREGEHYLADMFRVLRTYSANPIEDSVKLWDMLIFDYMIGNTDNHIKNHALLYDSSLHSIRLAPIYDMISTCIYESSTRNMALHIGDAYSIDDISKAHFAQAAEECGMGAKLVLQRFDQMAGGFEKALNLATQSLVWQGLTSVPTLQEKILKHGGYGLLK